MRIFIVLLLAAFALTGCDSGDNKIDCFTIDEVRESDCLADAMLNACDRIGCSSENTDLFPPLTPNCEFVDCETFDCEEVSYSVDGMTFTAPGTFTDLHNGETGGLNGTIDVEREGQEFECFFVVP